MYKQMNLKRVKDTKKIQIEKGKKDWDDWTTGLKIKDLNSTLDSVIDEKSKYVLGSGEIRKFK
jgi:hypothetical protein